MTYVKNLYHDEIREDILVKSNIKKVWNRQLEIWAEVDRICRKHAIKYQINYGTLLGAMRHKGFIPWDEDVDVSIMRPEFNRLAEVLDDELDGGDFVAQNFGFDTIKIFHKQTTLIYGHDYSRDKPSGIIFDVFALDILEDGTVESSRAFAALKKAAAFDSDDNIKNLRRFAEELFDQSRAVEWFDDTLNHKYKTPFRKEWFDETIYLPFETVTMPAPKMFDEILTSYYGDWRTPVRDGQPRLGFVHSPDIPYEEFWRRVDMQELLRKKIRGGLDNWLS